MGYTDPNGIFIYEETDDISPISEYENKGQRSVSEAIGLLSDVVESLTAAKPSGWQDVTFQNGFTQHTAQATWGRCQYRTTGGTVQIRGHVQCPSGYVGQVVMFNLPIAARPEFNIRLIATDTAGADLASRNFPVSIIIEQSGNVKLENQGVVALNMGLIAFPQKGY